MTTIIELTKCKPGVKTVPVKVPSTMQFTKEEMRLIEEILPEINKKLVEKENSPLRATELIHIILKTGLERVSVSRQGQVVVK